MEVSHCCIFFAQGCSVRLCGPYSCEQVCSLWWDSKGLYSFSFYTSTKPAEHSYLSEERQKHTQESHTYTVATTWCCHSRGHHKQLLISQNVIKAGFQERLAESSAQGHFLKMKGSTNVPGLQNSNLLQCNMSNNFNVLTKDKLIDETACFTIGRENRPYLYL